MLRMTPGCKVYLALGPTDLRGHIDGLALMVEKKFRLDPFENAFFVFCNRKRDKLKVLYWDKNGFWLFYRRLEQGTFRWLVKDSARQTIAVTKQQICTKCGSPLHEMKTQMRVEIEVIPASVHVVKHMTKIYACRNCDKNGSATIIKAPGAPSPVIEKSFASSSLLADIFTMKFVYGVPFFRQEKDKQARQIPVTRNNMCNWCITVANDYFKPLTDVMKKILYADHVIHCDETYVQVLHEPDRPATSKSYVWVTASAQFQKEHKIALYNYTQTRGSFSLFGIRAEAERKSNARTGGWAPGTG